jgi:hypothetical protein
MGGEVFPAVVSDADWDSGNLQPGEEAEPVAPYIGTPGRPSLPTNHPSLIEPPLTFSDLRRRVGAKIPKPS